MSYEIPSLEPILEWGDESSDGSWSSSSLVSDDSLDDEDIDWNKWRETPLLPNQVTITMDSIEPKAIEQYNEEVTQIKARLQSEVKSIRAMYNMSGSHKIAEDAALTVNEIMNCFLSPVIAMEMIGVMNKGLHAMGCPPMDNNEFELVIRLIFYFSYYNKGPANICSNPEMYPEPAELVAKLHGSTDNQRHDRLLALLRSFEGDGGVNHQDVSVTWTSVYDTDQDLENLFHVIGRQASKLCFVKGRTDLIIDDDKLKLRSKLAAALGFVRSKGLKSFGPVANCMNSLATGFNLSSYMTHHGESALAVTQANLMRIAGVQSPTLAQFPDTSLGGDRGYSDDDAKECADQHQLNVFNTVKRGPSQPFKFGKTSYKQRLDVNQRDIPEQGPCLSLGATKTIGGRTLYQTAWRNGTDRVTLLQSTKSGHAASNIEYESIASEKSYSKLFQAACSSGASEEVATCLLYKEQALIERGLVEECKGQGTPEWFALHRFRASSTLAFHSLPKTKEELSQDQVDLLETKLGLRLAQTTEEVPPPDPQYANKSKTDLQKLTVAELKEIAKSYNRPVSGTKSMLADNIKKGPREVIVPTDVERMLKHTFFAPLKDKDKTPHKIGILNEAKVRGALASICKNLGYDLIDAFECGLISQITLKYFATSLDGWLVLKLPYVEVPTERQKTHVALEIKSPTSKDMRERVHQLRDDYGEFTECTLGSLEFLELVYKQEYRAQVLHHAAVCGFDKVLFVVANEYKPIYATMVTITREQRDTYISIVSDYVYEKSLKWAYTTAWDAADPQEHFPEFRESAISTANYSIDSDTLAFHFAIWRNLLKKLEKAGMPLPIAKRIVPSIVCYWNKEKGRIDEMSGYLKKIQWHLAQATPKQRLTLREIQKMGLNAFLAKKHCFNTVSPEKFEGRSFSQIRRALSKHEGSLSDFCLSIARTYRFMAPVPGLVTRSPLKRTREDEEEHTQQGLDSVRVNLARRQEQRLATEKCQKIKRNQLQHFRDDPELNVIRLNRSLNHQVVQASGNGRQCVLCSSGRRQQGERIHTTVFRCPTCWVHLCMRCHDGKSKRCTEKWHNIKDPKNLGA